MEHAMALCDVCGNDYDKAFTLTQGDRTGTFDSFEWAIHAFAPECTTAASGSAAMAPKATAGSCAERIANKAGVTGIDDRT
jgi:hypothetical protein